MLKAIRMFVHSKISQWVIDRPESMQVFGCPPRLRFGHLSHSKCHNIVVLNLSSKDVLDPLNFSLT